MYAIVEDGGKQYKMEPGLVVCVETRDVPEGQSEIEFDRVLMIRDEADSVLGRPLVDGAKVTARVNGIKAGPKLYPMSFRRRKDSQRRMGHRQKYLEVEVTAISKP